MEHVPDNYEMGYLKSPYNEDIHKICPMCDKECTIVYYDKIFGADIILGCENCIGYDSAYNKL